MVTNATATTELVETGEKRDRRGRKITPVARRGELVAAWRASGMTQAEFARREGVNYTTLASWVQLARRRETAPVPIRFAEVRVPVSKPAAEARVDRLEVRLPDGTVVRGDNAAALVRLVRALRG